MNDKPPIITILEADLCIDRKFARQATNDSFFYLHRNSIPFAVPVIIIGALAIPGVFAGIQQKNSGVWFYGAFCLIGVSVLFSLMWTYIRLKKIHFSKIGKNVHLRFDLLGVTVRSDESTKEFKWTDICKVVKKKHFHFFFFKKEKTFCVPVPANIFDAKSSAFINSIITNKKQR